MDLHTETIGQLAGVTTAQLDEYTSGEGVLNLEFAGWGPDWLSYMEEVSLFHRGNLIFHGKITSFSRANSGGAVRATATVHNFFWLLERQTLGQQIAEIEEAVAESNKQTDSDSGSGEQPGKDSLYAIQGVGIGRVGKGQIGKNNAKKNPYGKYIVNWGNAVVNMSAGGFGWKLPRARAVDDGLISVRCGWGVTDRQMWTVTDKLITTASALWRMRAKTPDVQYIVDYAEGTVTAMNIGSLYGVTWDTGEGFLLAAENIAPQYEQCVTGVAIAWTNDEGVTEVHTYPEGLDMAQDGVKVFHLTGTYYVESWEKVAQEYYEAANVLQYGGSVTVLMDRLTESPLGHLLSLTGEGTHESWHSMCAVVTHVTWDFLERTLTANLGREFSDPEFADAQETEDGGEAVEEYFDGVSSSGDGSGDGSGGFPVIPNPGETDSPVNPPGSVPGSETESESATETDEPTRPAHTSNDCGCAPKWIELEEWKKSIEERLKALEEGGTGNGTCGCECAGLLAEIQAAVNAAAAGVTVSASVAEPVMTTETGTLSVSCAAEVTADGGSGSVNFHY